MSATHFERVSFEQFRKDMENLGLTYIFPNGGDQIRQAYDNIRLPRRATPDSAGYDFSLPFPVILRPCENITIPTGICVELDPGQFLLCLPRSGLGFRGVGSGSVPAVPAPFRPGFPIRASVV